MSTQDNNAGDGRVSRLPPLPRPLPPEVEELFQDRLKRMGRILNIHHVFGHAPKLSRASAQMAYSLRNETSVARLYIEIAIVRAAQHAKGVYEVQQHAPMLLAEGFSREKLDALENWRTSGLFDEKERALLAYTDETCNCGDVSDATFAAMEQVFTPQQIMELTFAIGSYYGTALVMNALRIKLEGS
ncbi:MAG TPA: carboxymuconolactone decarboxylase family protein [Xanthobacteraceae bacterium]|nr:carboxymuconolactone decarboxylase family protein [Xanthobacteraceae bacterium]